MTKQYRWTRVRVSPGPKLAARGSRPCEDVGIACCLLKDAETARNDSSRPPSGSTRCTEYPPLETRIPLLRAVLFPGRVGYYFPQQARWFHGLLSGVLQKPTADVTVGNRMLDSSIVDVIPSSRIHAGHH